MFLQLNHKELNAYITSRSLLTECYKVTGKFPAEERFTLTHQIRRAALSVLLNIAEGASRKSPAERKRFYEVSRSSLVEVDAAFDVALHLHYLEGMDLEQLSIGINKGFQLLTGMINSTK